MHPGGRPEAGGRLARGHARMLYYIILYYIILYYNILCYIVVYYSILI